MQRTDFEDSLQESEPPEAATVIQQALWWVKNNNWQRAHDLIGDESGSDAAWMHALLHRMEGDDANANYWYQRAGKTRPKLTIGRELEELMDYFLEK